MEGTAGSVAFDTQPQASLEEMLGGQGKDYSLKSIPCNMRVNASTIIMRDANDGFKTHIHA